MDKILTLENIKALEIGLNNTCNLACPMCTRQELKSKVKNLLNNCELNLDILKKRINELNIERIEIVGSIGEPLFYSSIFNLIEFLNEKNIRIIISTNGSIKNFNFEKLGRLLKENDIIRFPMDGTFETHSIYRKNSDLNLVLNNIKKLKKETKATIILQTIIFKYNENQLDEIFKIFKESEADLFELTHTGYSEYLDDQVRPVDELLKLYKKNDKIANEKKNIINCEAIKDKKIYLNCFGYFLPCENLDEYVFLHKDDIHSCSEANLNKLFYQNNMQEIIKEINSIIKNKQNFVECHQSCGLFNNIIRKKFDVFQFTKNGEKYKLKKYRLLYND